MKKFGLILSIVTLLAFSGAAFGLTFVTIGTGGVGGTYYPLGGSMAEVLTKADIGVKATARSTAASKENCRLVASGRAQIGMSMGSTLYQAYTGVGAFEKDGKLPLATLMNMYPAPEHLVTTSKTGIKTLEDIRGKKVSIGAPGSGNQVLVQLILEAAGMNPEKDFQKQQLTQPEAAMALKDGNVEAVFWNFAAPGSAVMEVAAVRDVVLIPLPKDLVDRVVEQNPFLFAYTLKKGTYTGQTEDVLTVADGNFLVVRNDMDEELGYNLAKTFVEGRDSFIKVTQQAVHFVPEEASVGIIPFTTGSVKYFKEQGIEVK